MHCRFLDFRRSSALIVDINAFTSMISSRRKMGWIILVSWHTNIFYCHSLQMLQKLSFFMSHLSCNKWHLYNNYSFNFHVNICKIKFRKKKIKLTNWLIKSIALSKEQHNNICEHKRLHMLSIENCFNRTSGASHMNHIWKFVI